MAPNEFTSSRHVPPPQREAASRRRHPEARQSSPHLHAITSDHLTTRDESRPYNISVLQISNFVVPPGVITKPRAPPPPKMMSSVSAVAPSPAPVRSPSASPSPSSLPCPPVTMPIEEPMEETPAPAPAPSQGYALQAMMGWWSGAGVALGMACVLAHL
uniref:Uncharacterized protein n=1 Tax=Aegilops tauschii TaxID=37682 RepID=R7W0B9_AEGTA